MVTEQPTPVQVWDAQAGTLREPTAAEQLEAAKETKEAELRDAAKGWYEGNVRSSFEGTIVAAKWAKNLVLNAEEQAIFDEMNANYQRLKTLVGQVRAAPVLAEVEAITW